MASLEDIPKNILQNIAFMCFASSPLGPPQVQQLMLVSRTIHAALNVVASPDLYARFFRIYFDIATPLRKIRLSKLTDVDLAAELVRRFHVLRRIRLGDISDENLRVDLWTMYLMVLESDGRNETQLAWAGLSQYIFEFIRSRFRDEYQTFGCPMVTEVNSLALWLACLTVSSQTITNDSPAVREETYALLRPLAVAYTKYPAVQTPESGFAPDTHTPSDLSPASIYAVGLKDLLPGTCEVIYYSRSLKMTCPSISTASALLVFLLKEASHSPQVPPHLPENRAIAEATKRSGPTMEDYAIISKYRTPTVADPSGGLASSVDLSGGRFSRSQMQNDEFNRVIIHSTAGIFTKGYAYAPGMLTGLWEGLHMLSPPDIPEHVSLSKVSLEQPDFNCRRPMQCYLREHLMSYPEGALPDANLPSAWGLGSQERSISEAVDSSRPSLPPRRSNDASSLSSILSSSRSDQDAERGLYARITGETQSDHDQAWGAFKYDGRVRFRDGMIVLKREPKDPKQDYHGIWIFEGFLHSRRAIVGRWHSTKKSINDARLEGIFCLSKKPEVLVRDTSWPSRL